MQAGANYTIKAAARFDEITHTGVEPAVRFRAIQFSKTKIARGPHRHIRPPPTRGHTDSEGGFTSANRRTLCLRTDVPFSLLYNVGTARAEGIPSPRKTVATRRYG